LGDWSATGRSVEKITLLGVGVVVGVGVYVTGSYWVKNEEMLFLLKVIRTRR